jgi:hypothetical protein
MADNGPIWDLGGGGPIYDLFGSNSKTDPGPWFNPNFDVSPTQGSFSNTKAVWDYRYQGKNKNNIWNLRNPTDPLDTTIKNYLQDWLNLEDSDLYPNTNEPVYQALALNYPGKMNFQGKLPQIGNARAQVDPSVYIHPMGPLQYGEAAPVGAYQNLISALTGQAQNPFTGDFGSALAGLNISK